MHGGKSPQAKAKAAERIAVDRARKAMSRSGFGQGEVDGDPAEFMLAQVKQSAYNVERLREALGELEEPLGDPGLVELYNAERDRLVKYSSECRRAGVEERRIEITAELGRQLVDIVRGVAGVVVAGVLAMMGDHPELAERVRGWSELELPALAAAEVARVRAGEGSAA
jgi:hypothetical protein